MHAFNLTRLNFHSPYKVWIDNGSYKFLTDYGVQYRIEFVENNKYPLAPYNGTFVMPSCSR